MRALDGVITCEDFDGAPVASLPAKFRMPEIERYTGIGCPCIHLRLYSQSHNPFLLHMSRRDLLPHTLGPKLYRPLLMHKG